MTLNTNTMNRSEKNPNGRDVITHRSPHKTEIAALDAESAEVAATIRGLL